MAGNVQFFSMRNDQNCQSVATLLKELKVEHSVIEVDQDEDRVNELVAKTGQWSVPALVIGGDLDGDGKPDMVIVGNEQAMIRNALVSNRS